MKAYTDIEQSQKLAEILPPESADMYWWPTSIRYYIDANEDDDFNEEEGHIRAWSLAALLEVLPNSQGIYTKSLYWFDDAWHCEYVDEDGAGILGTSADNSLDACYGMILKLHELNKKK